MSQPGISHLSLDQLASELGWPATAKPGNTDLAKWQTEIDDGHILRHLYQNLRPRRHLEFGTWQGFGTCLCLESCEATVWTLNLPDGENKPDGGWAYGERVTDESKSPPGAVSVNFGHDESGPRTYHRTDAGTYIGRLYREKGLGHRVCQIYCDSRNWSTVAYPADFFQSVFIDGGHQPDVVINDTLKALPLLQSGGMMLWHDFCPLPEIAAGSPPMQGVVAAIDTLLPELDSQFSRLAWINPSYLMIGIKR